MKELVKMIDPTLTYREEFYPASVQVFKVQRKKVPYILKVPRVNEHTNFSYAHLKQEEVILTRLAEVDGITHLVASYHGEDAYKPALLKEFFEGETLGNLNVRLKDSRLRDKLEAIIKEIHCLGIARLDLTEDNVALSRDELDICIIDLGFGCLSELVSTEQFKEFKAEDWRDFRKYFS